MRDKPKPLSKREQHIARRKAHGLSVREIGREFGISKSSAHRALKKGYVGQGKAQ